MAYVLGFFAADGTMILNNRGAHFIEFHITDRSLLYALRRAVGSDHKIATRTRDVKWKLGYRLQVGSKAWFTDLQTLGFTPNKSSSMKFPVIPDAFFGAFVRGYFDGDGCVYFKKHIVKDRTEPRWIFSTRFTSGSKDFLVSLLGRLRLCGINGGFIVEKTRGHELVFSHRDSVALFHIMYDTMPVGATFLRRKYVIFRKALWTLYKLRP